MFSEPTIESVSHLFYSPGLELELAAAVTLACGILCYIARVAYLAITRAHRLEQEAAKATANQNHDSTYNGPYCAG